MDMKKQRLFGINMPKGYSKLLHLVMLLMSFAGTIMVTSASMYNASNASLTLTLIKQVGFTLISYLAMVFLARHFNWSWFRTTSKVFPIIVLVLIGSLLLPRLFPEVNGSHNWIPIGSLASIQPSELAKPFIIAIVSATLGYLPTQSWMLDKKKLSKVKTWDRIKRAWSLIKWPVYAVMFMLAIIQAIQNDFGTFMILVFTCAVIVFMANHPFITLPQRILLALFVFAVMFFGFAMTPNGVHLLESFGMKQYQLERITSLYTLFERDNMLRQSMQQVNGLLAFAKGGFFGNGLGNSILKYGYIPAQESDYILAILIDEFGFFGFAVITFLYGIILYKLFKNAFKINHQPSRLFLIGAATYIFVHYLFNVGGTSGLIPLTGVPLLLISAGGSSQLGIFMTIGICQNIIARHNVPKVKKNKA